MRLEKPSCESKEIALKSFFLGPQAENAAWVETVVSEIVHRWADWRRSLYPKDGAAISPKDQADPEYLKRRESFELFVRELLARYEDEVPKFSPRYIGHMFSELSLPALFGHIVTLLHNPNNISGESSRVGTKLEDEAIEALAKMVGFDHLAAMGHFTSGGTVANFEALLRARERVALWMAMGALQRECGAGKADLWDSAHMGWAEFERQRAALVGDLAGDLGQLESLSWTEGNPLAVIKKLNRIFEVDFQGPVFLIPESKHYSWKKGISLLGLGSEAFWPVQLDSRGKLSLAHLERRIEEAARARRPVAMVVSVAGTTELGEIDPIDGVEALLEKWRERGIHIWHHVDAAYGGFFCSMDLQNGPLSAESASALRALGKADSVTLDPHKLGYVPYSSGAFLAREKRDYFVKSFTAPYVQFDAGSDRGPYTIEGSRSAAGAAATWMSSRCIGFDPEGYGRVLARTVRIRQRLEEKLVEANLGIRLAPHADTNILCFTIARDGEPVAAANERALRIYETFSPKGEGPFFVSKTTLSWGAYGEYLRGFVASWNGREDGQDLTLVRVCLMNPFFDSKEMSVDFADEFIAALRQMLALG